MMLVVGLLLSAPAIAAPTLPDPLATPGAVNPAITQETIGATICNRTWSTRSIRPSVSYTNGLKRQQLASPHYADKNPRHYEEDHLISLELGGAPSDPRNLWPQAWDGACGARAKDRLEDRLHGLVCRGALPLAAAQHDIAANWIDAYRIYVGTLNCDEDAPQ